jgi:hypothetical protein
LNQSEAIQFPDFFLVGTPRCGPAALSRYLMLTRLTQPIIAGTAMAYSSVTVIGNAKRPTGA